MAIQQLRPERNGEVLTAARNRVEGRNLLLAFIDEDSVINRLISAYDGVQPGCDILFQSGFSLGGEGPVPRVQILARSTRRAGPPGSRYSLSHFRRRGAIWKPIGSRLMEGRSCANVPFACATRSSVMAVAVNRPTTKITTGFRSAAAFAIGVKRRSPFCRRSLRRIATTA